MKLKNYEILKIILFRNVTDPPPPYKQTLIETAYRYLQCIVFKVFLNRNLL